jgi:hypothetical protein
MSALGNRTLSDQGGFFPYPPVLSSEKIRWSCSESGCRMYPLRFEKGSKFSRSFSFSRSTWNCYRRQKDDLEYEGKQAANVLLRDKSELVVSNELD